MFQKFLKIFRNGVHLAFFAGPSGVVRFHNQSLGDRVLYEQPQAEVADNASSNPAPTRSENRNSDFFRNSKFIEMKVRPEIGEGASIRIKISKNKLDPMPIIGQIETQKVEKQSKNRREISDIFCGIWGCMKF